MRGPFLIEWHLLRRGVRTWLLVRVAFALALMVTASLPTASGGLVGLGVVSLSAVLAIVDVQRVQERVLLANLGLAAPALVTLLAAAAVVGEITLALLLR